MIPEASKKNQSIGKAFQIIEVMADAKGPIKLQELSEVLKLPSSTILRFLKTLMDFDYVNQNQSTLQYHLTFKFCRIAERVSSQIPIRDIARPFLIELSQKTDESASLAIERGMSVVYIDMVEGPDHLIRTLQKIGKEAPMHCTGVGKVFLQGYDTVQRSTFYQNCGFESFTQKTIIDQKSMEEELKIVEEQGFALDNEECEPGVKCVAAPIRDYTDSIVAAISISVPIDRLPPERLNGACDNVIEIAIAVSQKLGYE